VKGFYEFALLAGHKAFLPTLLLKAWFPKVLNGVVGTGTLKLLLI
jgi:hypothetical protein